MSRRIFAAVARGIKKSTVGIDGVGRELMVANVSRELSEVYPTFDHGRFADACRRDPAPIDSPENKE